MNGYYEYYLYNGYTSLSIVFCSIVILNLAVLIALEPFLPPICALILSINPSYSASARRAIY